MALSQDGLAKALRPACFQPFPVIDLNMINGRQRKTPCYDSGNIANGIAMSTNLPDLFRATAINRRGTSRSVKPRQPSETACHDEQRRSRARSNLDDGEPQLAMVAASC
jgi:hypothetical protein